MQPFTAEYYLEYFGIVKNFNSEDVNVCSTFAVMAMHKIERVYPFDLKAKRREQYILYGIYDAYKISLDEFVNRPLYELEQMIEEQKYFISEKNKLLPPPKD